MLLGDARDRLDGPGGPLVFGGGNQSQVPFRKVLPAEFGDGAEHRQAAVMFDAVAQLLLVPGVGHPV